MTISIKTLTFVTALCLLIVMSAYVWSILLLDPSLIVGFSNLAFKLNSTIFGKMIIGLIGLVTLTCAILMGLFATGFEPKPPRQVTITNESGTVGVSLSAIEEFIRRKGKSVPGIRDLSVKADEIDGALFLQNKIVLELQKNIPEFTKEFHNKVRYELEHSLGIENVSDVKVHIKKIYPKDSAEAIRLGAPTKLLLKEPDSNNLSNDTDEQSYVLLEEDFKEDNFTVISKQQNKEDKNEY